MDNPDDEDPGEDPGDPQHIPVIKGLSPSDLLQPSREDPTVYLFPPPSRPFLASTGSVFPRRTLVLPPLARTREIQNRCRHTAIEIRYCIDEYEVCQTCGRRPLLNWLYYCVEDTTQRVNPLSSPIFAPWAIKAIEEGQYTEEQQAILMQQKLHVLESASYQRATDLDPETTAPELAEELAEEVGEPEDTDEDEAWVENIKDTAEPVPQSPGDPSVSPEEGETPNLILPPRPCNFSACRTCEVWELKTSFTERVFLNIDEVCNDAIQPPSAWDLYDRPVSNVNIVRTLGLRYRPPAGVDRNDVRMSGMTQGDVGVAQEDSTIRPDVDMSTDTEPAETGNDRLDQTASMEPAA